MFEKRNFLLSFDNEKTSEKDRAAKEKVYEKKYCVNVHPTPSFKQYFFPLTATDFSDTRKDERQKDLSLFVRKIIPKHNLFLR